MRRTIKPEIEKAIGDCGQLAYSLSEIEHFIDMKAPEDSGVRFHLRKALECIVTDPPEATDV